MNKNTYNKLSRITLWASMVIFFLIGFMLARYAFSAEKETTGLWISAYVQRVVDGDTFILTNGIEDRCRMFGYNTPEEDEDPKLWELSTKKLEGIFSLSDNRIYIFTQKRDKYNRMVCHAYLPDGTDVNSLMRKWLEAIGYSGVGKYDYLGGL